MSLNIKNERTHELVRELAELTGMSQTSAVEDAVRRRLAELAGAPTTGTAALAVDFSPGEIAGRSATAGRVLRQVRDALSAADRRALVDAEARLYDDDGLFA